MSVTVERGSSVGVDPITLEVVRHSLVAIMDEAEANLTRTAFSTIIREAKDYAVGMVTAKGETIAQSRGSIPTFVADLGTPVLDGIAMWGEDIHEGDYLINNWAGVCGQHLNNVVMYTPIFEGGRIVVFAALRTHWPDIGGGARTAPTTEIFQEGIQFRNAKIYSGDRINVELERIIRYNTRRADATFGDLEAQIAGCRLQKLRFEELLRRYGWKEIERAIHACWDQSERYVRQQIREIPNGRYYAESFLDSDNVTDEPIPVRATVIVEDESITIDYGEMPPQVTGPYNSGTTGGAHSAAKVSFKGAISPFLLVNEGEFRPLRVLTQPGTLLSASADAAMGSWSIPIKTVIDVTLRAFSQALPDRIAAGSNCQYGTAGARGIYPGTRDFWNGGSGSFGGWGGHARGDGQSGMRTTTHGDTRNTPVEVHEAEAPVLTLRSELVQDSAGAGKFRGGLGHRSEVLLQYPGIANVNFDRAKFPPWGLYGGKDGAPGYGTITKPGEEPLRVTKVSRMPVPAGTRIAATNNGGGGWGHPFDRDPLGVEWDVRQGYVSLESAIRDYGVLLDEHGKVDQEATGRHRLLWRDAKTPEECCE